MNRIYKIWAKRLLAVFFLFSATCAAQAADSDTLMLLLPDGTPMADQRVAAWMDTAREEGVRIKILYDSQFMNLGSAAHKYRGLILPDQIHVNAADALIAAINNYVAAGGHAMLVYDFGALSDTGFYAVPKSRLSSLAGVDYVLYEELREKTIGLGHITGMESSLWKLGVPPGKSMPYNTSAIANLPAQVVTQTQSDEANYLASDSHDPGGLKGYRHSHKHRYKLGEAIERIRLYPYDRDDKEDSDKLFRGKKTKHSAPRFVPATPTDEIYGISGYVYGFLTYPSFVTRGDFAGSTLLSSPNFGLVAGVNAVGAGKVLFVNMPLTYLKGQTDGMLMHGLVRYFATDMLKMPVLAKMPKGKGGLVLNWHVDDGQAIDAIADLSQYGVWKEGPYSMHFTAGPDVNVLGDGLGMDLPNNNRARNWMKYLAGKGNQIAAHGGWIHNVYGMNANESNAADYLPYLELNRDAIVDVLGGKLTEYSAPQGNNPSWALNWLESEGILAYYSGGHTGMPFTRNYQNGQLTNAGMWAFPVTPFGPVATFEEFVELGMTHEQILPWYKKLADFSAVSRSSYLIYMHPPGAIDYPKTVVGLLNRAKELKAVNRFQWYTMTDLARFAQRHLDTVWDTTESAGGKVIFKASHPSDLTNMTWLLPVETYSVPKIRKGKGRVYQDGTHYVVTASGGKSLEFYTRQGAVNDYDDEHDDEHHDDHDD